MIDESSYRPPQCHDLPRSRAYSATALVLLGIAWLVYLVSVAMGSLEL
jgi:hypothetical protein